MTTLPTCIDIEKLVLGYCLMEQAYLDTARPSVQADDFCLDAHRRIWHHICTLFDAGRPVDRVTVFQELMAHGDDKAVGGLSYIVSLDDGLPCVPRIDDYLKRLRGSSTRRRIIATAEALQKRAADEAEELGSVLDAFTQAAGDFSRASDPSRDPISTRDMIRDIGIDGLLGPRHRGSLQLTTWPELNRALSGLSAGQIVLLMAATSRGKTSMALQMATCAASHQHTPVVWTMEMSPASLFRRMVAQLSGVRSTFHLAEGDRAAQRDAVGTLNDNPVYFDAHSRTVPNFIASVRQVRATFGNVGLGVVDYLQLIRTSNRGNRAAEVSENSRALKMAAMDLGIPIVVLSQVDRGSVKGEGKIGLHSAKESGDVENDADVVLWIESGELSRDANTMVSLHVGKQREGEAGFGIPMVFRPSVQAFNEVSA